jgi:predicted hydrocarbon binding protein
MSHAGSEGEKQVDTFYSLDYKSGIITNRVSGRRVMVLATEAWVSLGSVLRKAFGEGAPTYMRQVGYSLGVSLGHNIIGKTLSPSETNTAILLVARAGGWGKVTFSGDTERWTRYTARFENCPSCAEEQPGKPPVCDLLTGVVNGMEDEIFSKPHRVTETVCGYKKDGACEFLVEEIPEPTDEQKHWASYVLFPWLKSER